MQAAPICYIEIPAPDIEKSDKFYRSIFNWQINPSSLNEHQYRMFSIGEGQL